MSCGSVRPPLAVHFRRRGRRRFHAQSQSPALRGRCAEMRQAELGQPKGNLAELVSEHYETTRRGEED